MAGKASGLTASVLSRLLTTSIYKRLAGPSVLQYHNQTHQRTKASQPITSLDTLCSSSTPSPSSLIDRLPSLVNLHQLLGGAPTFKHLNSQPCPGVSAIGGGTSSSPRLLSVQPTGSAGHTVEQRRFYQAALRPRLICPGCYFVWRHGRKYVECSDHPRHKQMKRVAKRKMWKEDYNSGKWVKAITFHTQHHRREERNVDRVSMSHNWLAGKLGTQL